MRLFVAPILALTLAVGATTPDPQTPPRPIVLLVHGRGMLGSDTAELRREWKRDLDMGLQRAGLTPLADADVRLAWYADVLDPASEAKCVTTVDTSEIDFGGIARGFLASLGTAMERDGASEGRSLLGDLLFMMDSGTRCGARLRVASAVRAAENEGRPLVIVAYSLGSVVAYDHLRKLDSARTDIRLVTLGSPLGQPDLRALLTGGELPLTMPRSVRGWTNIYDRDDAFAAPLGMAGRPELQDLALSDTTQSDPHHVSRYLRDRETGAAVARVLCASAPAQFGRGCAKS